MTGDPTPAATPEYSWNEVHLLPWTIFRRMAPSVLQLEVRRLNRLIQALPPPDDFRNALVRARFELEQCTDRLGEEEDRAGRDSCAGHLRSAIMSLSIPPEEMDGDTRTVCSNIAERLQYVHDRINQVY